MFGLSTFRLLLIAVIVLATVVGIVALKRWFGPQPKPHTEVNGPYDVVSCENGASLTYTWGKRDRQRERNKTALKLSGVAAPPEGAFCFAESRDSLAGLAGKEITIQIEGRGRNREISDVYGESGGCLQVEQLKAGFCWLVGDEADRSWIAAQKEAVKAKRGVWAKPGVWWLVCPQNCQEDTK